MKISCINSYTKINSATFGQEKREQNHSGEKKSQIDELSSVYYAPYSFIRPFDARTFLSDLRTQNAQVERFNEKGGYICANSEAIERLKELDDLSLVEKKNFVQVFCEETGFPDLDKVRANAEKEIQTQIHQLARKNDFDVKFIAYDQNCSLGRGVALPGSDCDALFMIIDEKGNKPSWFSGAMRWQFKDDVNQRILSTPAGGLPEVLSTEYIEQGLELSNKAFKKAKFTSRDMKRFELNLNDSSNNFVRSAEFNIRLAEHIPNNDEIRTQAYKTAMLVELLRDGVIIENDFSAEFLDKIKQSPLYKYSNLMKQQGLGHTAKEKYIQREKMAHNFKNMNVSEQFSIVRDMIHASFQLKDIQNPQYFLNSDLNGGNIMGNILEMYDKVQHIDYVD